MTAKKRTTSPALWIIAMFLSTLCGLFGTLGTMQSGQHQKVSAASAPSEQAKVICPMEWTSPGTSSNAGAMPPSGAVSFDWTDHPTASAYSLTLITPNGSPVFYDAEGSSKDLFLENYTQVGAYQFVVTALGADGSALCSITMSFEMPEVSGQGRDKSGYDENESEFDSPPSVIPSNPVVPNPVLPDPTMPSPEPTEVEIH
jgi:hypothetical protein